MTFFPSNPLPASVHGPIVLDPAHRFETDSGVSLRRSKHSRMRRLFQLDYLGLYTVEMRGIREFLDDYRLTVYPFEWIHPVAWDTVTYSATTPIVLTFPAHLYRTGQWIGIANATHPILNGYWPITRLTGAQLSVDTTASLGATGTCTVHTYLPRAIGYFPEDRFDAPVKLIGPDSTDGSKGRWNLTVMIEELF
jgi:hypothetical protein